MQVSGSVWAFTLVGLGALLLFDLAIVGRRPHEPSLRECVLWVIFYVGLAGAFGLGLWLSSGPDYAGQFFAGWVTEYSLSVDNLFVFVILMARFAVPRTAQQKVLLVGIVLALLMRGAFIAVGAAAISRFDWVFYLFGAFLVYTAVRLASGSSDSGVGEFKENAVTKWARRVLPLSERYNNAHMTIRVGGRRLLTPMLVVMIAIGTTDLIFALDSIPAIFGLTQQPYLVFTANVFALMGLRQLYFLLGGLLNRLVYLSVGLSLVLGFIGVKLVLEALHANNVPFINGGDPFTWAPELSTQVSLVVIIGTLAITTVASLLRSRRTARRALVGATRTAALAGVAGTGGEAAPGHRAAPRADAPDRTEAPGPTGPTEATAPAEATRPADTTGPADAPGRPDEPRHGSRADRLRDGDRDGDGDLLGDAGGLGDGDRLYEADRPGDAERPADGGRLYEADRPGDAERPADGGRLYEADRPGDAERPADGGRLYEADRPGDAERPADGGRLREADRPGIVDQIGPARPPGLGLSGPGELSGANGRTGADGAESGGGPAGPFGTALRLPGVAGTAGGSAFVAAPGAAEPGDRTE